jgi:hypothetical protein
MNVNEHPTDLLAVLALDAIASADELEHLQRHLDGCPRCRQAVDGMRVVASALGNTVERPPERVWSGISSRLTEHPDGVVAVAPDLVPVAGMRRRRHAGPRARRRVRTITAVTTVAAVIALLAFGLVQSNDTVHDLQAALRAPTQTAIDAALVAPGHRTVALRSDTGANLGEFVLLPSGEGFLVKSEMHSAPAGKTYELWAIVMGSPIPVGLMGQSPTAVAFTVASSPPPSALAVTVEPQAGVVRPTSSPVGTALV